MQGDAICVCGHPFYLHRSYGCMGYYPDRAAKKAELVWCQCKVFRSEGSRQARLAMRAQARTDRFVARAFPKFAFPRHLLTNPFCMHATLHRPRIAPSHTALSHKHRRAFFGYSVAAKRSTEHDRPERKCAEHYTRFKREHYANHVSKWPLDTIHLRFQLSNYGSAGQRGPHRAVLTIQPAGCIP
jgi:hypothetical protein